jgi:methylated-DNA-[protein]-cysteine S-methyltransferase
LYKVYTEKTGNVSMNPLFSEYFLTSLACIRKMKIPYRLIIQPMYNITAEDEKKLSKLSPYQQSILRILAEVPTGMVTTYGDLAKELSRRNPKWSPKASRAVGTTMKNNVCGPQIPCHRVIKSDGSIGFFRGGEKGAVDVKIQMLKKEGVAVVKGKIDLKKYRYLFT